MTTLGTGNEDERNARWLLVAESKNKAGSNLAGHFGHLDFYLHISPKDFTVFQIIINLLVLATKFT
jgi:hypothetical protein